jgi:hypothetical protein
LEKEGKRYKKKETKWPRMQKYQVLISAKFRTNKRKGRGKREEN